MAYVPAASRYDGMKTGFYRRCGRSGLQLPTISIGCWHNFGATGSDSGHHADEASFHENCRQMLFTAFDNGITHFDLANNYGPPPGAAESRVGRILKEDFSAHRDELIISTKAGYYMWPGPYGEWGSRKYLLASLDASLKRLGLEYVDIFYSHRPDPHTPMEETLSALDTAVKSGKAIYAGISSYRSGQTAAVAGICEGEHLVKPIIHQPNYSMLDRWVEKDLLPITQQFGMGVIVFSPLAQGLLSDKYLNGIPKNSRAGTESGFLRPNQITDEKIAIIRNLNSLAQARGQTLAQMAISWILRLPAITSVLIGASKPEQIKENIDAVKATFTEDELTKIDNILAGKPA